MTKLDAGMMKAITSPKRNGDLDIKGRFARVPVLRVMLYGTEWQRYRDSLRGQLAERGAISDSVWGRAERLDAARKIERILEEYCWAEEFRFHPDDPYVVVGEWEIGDLSEVEALMEIEEVFDITIKYEEMSASIGEEPTFGEFVDYVLRLASNKRVKRTG